MTDFGLADPYAGVVKGVILGRAPGVQIVDLCHEVPPQDLRHAVFILAGSRAFFPEGTIFMTVVDPGVGTDRRILCAIAGGQVHLAPDNGILGAIPADRVEAVHAVERPDLYLSPVSATFQGRDVFAPVAAAIATGLDPRSVGPPVESYLRLELPRARRTAEGWTGEVLVVDRFGNLVTNVPGGALTGLGTPPRVWVRGMPAVSLARSYADRAPGELVAVVGSSGYLEVAVNRGSAAATLAAAVGSVVEVWL